MIITSVEVIPSGTNIIEYAWSGLRRYQNVNYVSSEIFRLQSPPEKQKANVYKQSLQVRDCLIQASEYFNAAKYVSLSTKPLLYYYGMMSLALSEILIKQDGDSSLDRARGKHSNHGLAFINNGNPSRSNTLSDSAIQLIARPSVRENGRRYGTFELWHRSSREPPVCGKETFLYANGATRTNTGILLTPSDLPTIALPDEGLDLLTIFKSIPALDYYLAGIGIKTNNVRSTITRTINEEQKTYSTTLVVHPSSQEVLELAYENMKFSANSVNVIDITDLSSGVILKWTVGPNLELFRGTFSTRGQRLRDNTYLVAGKEYLNELGLFYAGLFILGNYARYYPEQWMRDVDESSELAFITQEFLSQVEQRVPLLSLIEISQRLRISE